MEQLKLNKETILDKMIIELSEIKEILKELHEIISIRREEELIRRKLSNTHVAWDREKKRIVRI